MEFVPYQNETEAFATLWNIANPRYPTTVEQLNFGDTSRAVNAQCERFWLVENGERVAAYRLETPLNSPLEGELAFAFVVPQEKHAQIVFDHAQATARRLGATRLRINCDEDLWRFGFLLAQGCTEVERMWESILELGNFDPQPLQPKLETAKSAGLEIITLDTQLENPDFLQRYYDAVIELLADVPSSAPFVPWDFEAWKKRALYHPTFLSEAEFIGIIGGEIAGVSQLFHSSHTGTLQTGLTGVRRPFRALGVAVALKLAAAEYAKNHGYKRIKTMNHVINRPMLSINEAMGFIKQPATVKLEKWLEG